MSRAKVLELHDVTKEFGGVRAVDGFTLDVLDGCVQAIIGPNGAGKTTLFNVIGGTVRGATGSVRFQGQEVLGRSEDKLARAGIAKTFQQSSLFDGLTVAENVALAVRRCRAIGTRLLRSRYRLNDVADEVAALLGRAGLTSAAFSDPRNLSHGQRRQLEILLGLALRPRLLLLDEPAAGMSLDERESLIATVRELASDLTIILIEHDMEVVFAIADRIAVMTSGQLLFEGTPAEVAASPAVREAYLGDFTTPSESA